MNAIFCLIILPLAVRGAEPEFIARREVQNGVAVNRVLNGFKNDGNGTTYVALTDVMLTKADIARGLVPLASREVSSPSAAPIKSVQVVVDLQMPLLVFSDPARPTSLAIGSVVRAPLAPDPMLMPATLASVTLSSLQNPQQATTSVSAPNLKMLASPAPAPSTANSEKKQP